MSGNGTVIPLTPLAVDFWHVRKCPYTRLFFLSHMHSDHTVGLTSTWSDRPIYCSPLSAALLKLKLQVKEQWIHPLELDEPYTLPLDDIGKERLTVTLIDANHCPGSVMFLFQGYFGTILYTGDFRYTPSMLRTPCLRNDINIDVLYLDNTNCDPTRVLPTRRRAAEKIKELIRGHPDHDIVIGLYSLGKESLLVDLAMEFKSWVEVSVARMDTLRLLDLPDVFTTDEGAGRLKVVEQASIRYPIVQQWNLVSPTLAILPTSRPVASFHSNIHVVPYSDHSSYRELEDFISALKPSSLIPIVGDCLPGCLSALLPRRKRRDVLIPESVQNYMLQQQPSVEAVQRRHQRRQTPWSNGPRPCPRGVVFESPPRGAGVPSNVGWRSISPGGSKKRIHRLCGLHAMNTVAGETAMAESVELCQFSQSNFAAVQIVRNTVPSLMPVIKVRGARSTPRKTSNDPCSPSVQAGMVLSCEEVEEMEGSILQHLPFSQEVAGRRGVLDHSHVNQFCLTPSAVHQEDETLFI